MFIFICNMASIASYHLADVHDIIPHEADRG